VDAPHERSTPWAGHGAAEGSAGSGNAAIPYRPGSAVVAAWLGVASAVLLLGSTATLLGDAVPIGAGDPGSRWPTPLGSLLTCALAWACLLGSVSLFRGTGRALLLTAAWVQAGSVAVALISVGVSSESGGTSASTAVAVLLVGVVAVGLSAGTVRLGGRREVLGWLAASAAWRGLTGSATG
jgi:hypothetical protein